MACGLQVINTSLCTLHMHITLLLDYNGYQLICRPRDFFSFRDQVLEYMKRSETVIRKLLDVLMKNLNVTEIDETKESLLMGSKRTNLNYYPICPNPAELTVGVGRHSDVSTLTFLLQDDIGGLYVRGNNDSWIHVPPVSGPL